MLEFLDKTRLLTWKSSQFRHRNLKVTEKPFKFEFGLMDIVELGVFSVGEDILGQISWHTDDETGVR